MLLRMKKGFFCLVVAVLCGSGSSVVVGQAAWSPRSTYAPRNDTQYRHHPRAEANTHRAVPTYPNTAQTAYSQPAYRHPAPRTQVQPAKHRVFQPTDPFRAREPVVRGQQPAANYGGLPSHRLPSEMANPQRFAQLPTANRSVSPGLGFAPPPQPAAPQQIVRPGQVVQPGQPYGQPVENVPVPAGSGLAPIWQGHPWAQPVTQPPFTPHSPLVVPDQFTDIDVNLAETQTGRLVLGAGINSDAGIIGNVVIDEQNFDIWRWPRSLAELRSGNAFRGGGQRFRMELLPGEQVQRYSMSISEPYLFQTAVSFGLSGFYYNRVYTDWDEERKGGRISLGYVFPQRPDLSTNFQFRYENIDISDLRVPTLPDLAMVNGSNDLIGLKWQIAHDTRDSTVLPTEGHLIQLGFEQVVGTFSYPKFTGDYRRYFVMSERPDGSGRHILGLAGRLGVSGKDTPIYDRFFAGGFSTIRGFDFRGASPTKSGVTVGGEFQAIGSAEYRFPITASDRVFGSFFLDVGTVEEVADVDFDDVRITPGFELRVSVPQLGPVPIAVGLGFPIQHEQGDDIKNFHFFVGISR